LELREADNYPGEVASATLTHVVVIGMVAAIILSIVSAVFIVVFFRIIAPLKLIEYIVLFVTIPVIVLSIISGYIQRRRALRDAEVFIEYVRKLAGGMGTEKIELLEKPVPPHIGVAKYRGYYIVFEYYGGRTIYIRLLNPIEVERLEGYSPIYIIRKNEFLSNDTINDKRVRISKAIYIFPEPLGEQVVYGYFLSYMFSDKLENVDKHVKYIDSLIDKIKTQGEL
jgi:hypothetical protein